MNHFWSRYRASIALGACATLALTACSFSGGSGGEQSAEKVTLAVAADYDSLDPAATKIFSGYQLATAFYDRLVALDQAGKVVPFLAETWKSTPTVSTFVIKSGVECADGSDVTASVVADSLSRLADPKTNAPYVGRTFGDGDVSVTGDDESRTVKIELSEPFNEMLTGLAMPWSGIVCGNGLVNTKTLAKTPSGSGPYTLDKKSSLRGSKYELVRRDDYVWGPRGLKGDELPKSIRMRVMPDYSSVANELTAGSVDIGRADFHDVKRLREVKSLRETEDLFNGSYFLYMRQAAGSPMAKKEVRQAIAHSFDHDAVTKVATLGLAKTAMSYLSGAVSCYGIRDKSAITMDRQKAEALLEGEGYDKNEDGVWTKNGDTLRLRMIATSGLFPAGSERLLADFKDFGFDVKLRQMPFADLFDVLANESSWDIAVFPYGPPIPSPNSATSFLATGSANNWAKIRNGEFDKASKEGLSAEVDSEAQCSAWEDAQSAIVEDADVIPLWTPVGNWFSTDRVDAKGLVTFGGASVDVTSIRTTAK